MAWGCRIRWTEKRNCGWTDRREVRFYALCFLLLCLMIVLIAVSLTTGDWRWVGSVFLVLIGFAPVVWRALV